MELERARALLAEQNAALELATVEAEIADVKANLAMESLRIGTAEFVNRFDFAPVGYGFQQSGPFGGMFSLSSSTDRVHGRDYPWLVSEADIRNSVGLARLVTKSHCPGVAIERNLKAHVIGKGGNYTAGVRKGAKVPDGLLEAIQDLVDEFVDENKILGEGEHEWYWRGVRDGETIVGLYPMPKGRHGIVDAREIEPLQVCTPGMAPLTDEEIVKRCGHDITCATNWEFGVHKADHDAQQIFGYAIEYDGDWDYLPARYVGHWKRNVDRNVCRGVTDFYQAWQWISEQSRLLGNTTAGAAERSAIAYIVQHIQGVTQAKVRSMRSDKADATYTYTGPSGATKQFHRENIPPGSKLDIPKGQEYVAIANGTDPSSAYISVLQAISRQVGIVWNMPEGMISGDDSGASVTASVVAGSRFDKFATMEQGAFGSFMLGILWKVIKFAYDRGRLERFGFSRDKDGSFYQLKKKIELIVKYPDVSNKHPIETEQLRQIRKQNGVLSVKTWTDEVGLDYETERKNMEEEQGGQGGGPPGMPPGGPGGMSDQGGMPGMPPGGMPPMPPDQGGGGFGGPPPAPAPGPNPFQQATGYDPYIESPQPGEPVGGQTAYAQPSGGVTFRNAPGFGSQEQFARSLATVVESAVEKAVGKLAEELKSGGASESFFGHRGRPGAVGGSSPRAEPWQLTQAQYREQHPKVVAANKAIAEALENLSSVMRHSDNRGDWFSAGAKASAQLEKAKAEADAEHEQHVLSRLMKGQDVPPHVLADYPHANPKVVLSGGDALPDMLAKLGSLGVAEAHAPAGFNHTSPLVIDGKSYVGGQFVPGKSQSEVDAAAKVIRKDKDNSTQLDDRLTSMYNNRPTRQAAVVIRSLPDLIGRSASAFAGRDKINNDIDKVLSANGIVPGSDEHALAMDVVANKFTAMTDAEAEMEKRRTSVHPLVKDLMAELSEIGSHSASSLSDTHYFKTDDGLVIRYGDHAPIHSRSISDVEVVGHPYGEGWLHPSTVQVVTANKTAKQVGEEVKAALDEIRERKRRESSASTPAVREWASKKFANPEHAKAFVEWFGDSKVVDKNGEPLVVYHGTSADFDEFDTAGGNDLGSHFGSIRQSDDLNKTEGGRTIPVYLSIKNPLRLPDLERWNDESMLPNLKEHGIDVEIPKREYVSADMATNYMHNIKMKRKAIAAALDKAGYDGIVYSNTFEGGGEKLKGDAADSYIVFSPRQIKSATGNRGTFDPASNKITESIADQYGLTASERLAFEHATSWMPYHGPRGGHGWQSMQTGRVLYQIERPGDSQHEGPSADEPSSEAIRAQQAERERAARLERESREREIARRGQAKQSAMSQREMELQSERQRPEQAKRAAIAERERAEREHEEEKPKPVKPYPKGKVSPFTAEVIDDARHIPFVDEVQQIASDDYDGIEAAMTPAEKREMNESLDTKKQEYIDKRQEGEREYDDDKAREDYLDQFYQDNEDRFVKTGEMEWGIDSDGDRVLRFTTDDGSKYEISAQTVYPIPVLAGSLQISFSERDGGYKITGKAGVKTAMDVFRKVSASVVALVQNESPPALTFTAAEPSRQRLYDKMVQHVAAASPDYAAVAAKKLGGVKGYLVCRRDVLGKLRARYDSGSIASTLANGGELQTLVEQSIGEMAMHKPTKEFTLSPDMELDEINVDPESLTEEDLLDTLAEIESMERDENNNQEHTE